MEAGTEKRLSERDREMLGDLIWAYDHHASFGWRESMGVVWDGVAPMDCGGTDGSDHSYRLTKLVNMGLAEHRKGATWGKAGKFGKGSKKYRPTETGRAVHAALKEPTS